MRFKYIWAIIILIILTLNSILPLPVTINADSNAPQDKSNGWWNTTSAFDWIVNTQGNVWSDKNISVSSSLLLKNGGELLFQNCTVIINNTIIIENNASLTLINTTLKFNGTSNGSSELQVYSGGSLYIRDYDNNSNTKSDASNITSTQINNTGRFTFYVFSNTNFSMINSELHQCGYPFTPDQYGLYIKSDNALIENNTFTNNYAGLIIESSNNVIKNNTFYNNDEYGFLIFIGRNNTLKNNSIFDNKYNFGLLTDDLNQSNNISSDNTINNNQIYYFENDLDFHLHSGFNTPGFVGIVNSDNITVSNQSISNNFNSLLLLGVNNSKIQWVNITKNNYGAISQNSKGIYFFNCSISDNIYAGIDLVNNCTDFIVENCSFINNSKAIRVSNSNLTIINSTINASETHDVYINGNSNVYAINSTLNVSKVQVIDKNSKFENRVFVHIQTRNHTEVPIGNVTIEIYNGLNNLVNKVTSNSSGIVNWIQCTSNLTTYDGTNYIISNHRFYVKFAGMEFNQYLNVSQAQDIIIYLNHPPTIINKPSTEIYVNEDSFYLFDFNCFDEDLDNTTWHFESNAGWLNPIDPITGIINGTPTNLDVGLYYLNISCNDSFFGFDYHNITIYVNNTNDKPEITSESKVGAETAYEDSLYLHDFDVLDPDSIWGETHNWSMETNASWLNPIHRLQGRVVGDPTQDDVGEYFVKILCVDKLGAKDFFNFTLIVHSVNDLPIITNRGEKVITIDEDIYYQHDFDYFDEDSNTVTWGMATDAFWLNDITTTGIIFGTPGDFDVGIYYVNITCTDPTLLQTYWNYSIKVRNTNDKPSFDDPQDLVYFTYEDELFERSFSIYDPDENDNYKLSLTLELMDSPRSLSLKLDQDLDLAIDVGPSSTRGSWLNYKMDQVTRTATVYGAPENHEVGIWSVNLSCADQGGESANIHFTLKVNNTNDAPEIINYQNDYIYVLEDSEYYYDFDFIDVDGDPVEWFLNTNADWLSEINSLTGELSGTPTEEDIGEYFVHVTCFDLSGGFDYQNYTIQVNNTNDPPELLNPCPAVILIHEDEYYLYDFNSFDKESKNVQWSSYTNATWLDPINKFTGMIFGTPTHHDIGIYFVNISCYDEEFKYIYYNYSIIVNNTNDPPALIKGSKFVPQEVDIYDQYYHKFKYFDPDGDLVTWKINTNAGRWLDFDLDAGVLSGKPSRLDIGEYYVNVSCSDPFGASDFYEYNIQVIGTPNRAPELFNGYVDPTSGDIATEFTFYVTYRDLDNDPPYTVVVKIDGKPLHLEHFAGDDFFVGVIYSNSTKLEEGSHDFYFQGADNVLEDNYLRATVANGTPSDQNKGIIEVDKESESDKSNFIVENQMFIIIPIVLVLVIIILALIFKKRRSSRKIESIISEEIKSFKSKEEEIEPESAPEKESSLSKPISPTVKTIETLDEVMSLEPELSDDLAKTIPDYDVESVEESVEEPGPEVDIPIIEEEPIVEVEAEVDETPALELEPEEIVEEPGPELKVTEDQIEKEEGETSDQAQAQDLFMCPQCGEIINETFEKCPGCGVKFIFDDEDMEPKANVESEAEAEAEPESETDIEDIEIEEE